MLFYKMLTQNMLATFMQSEKTTKTMIQLRQAWFLHLSSYLCDWGRLNSLVWATSGDEHNCTAKRKELNIPLTLCQF